MFTKIYDYYFNEMGLNSYLNALALWYIRAKNDFKVHEVAQMLKIIPFNIVFASFSEECEIELKHSSSTSK